MGTVAFYIRNIFNCLQFRFKDPLICTFTIAGFCVVELTTNLVVADASRTEKTICLAVSPSLKSYVIPGRARLFEVVQKVKQVNAQRQQSAPGRRFTGSSASAVELRQHPELSIDYIVAPPRMAHYMAHSAKIYEVYLKYVASSKICCIG